MGKLRKRRVERFKQFYVLVRVGEMVLPANDVCYFHADVVHNIHKVEYGSSVGAEYREILFL